MINTIVEDEDKKINDHINDLIYQYFFISQDLSAVHYDLGYSTWNLVYFLDPDYYFNLKGLPPSVLDKFGEASSPALTQPLTALVNFCEQLIQRGVNRPTVDAVKGSLSEWLEWSRRYRLIIQALYESEDPVETIYAFHHGVSLATRLLAISFSMKLSLKPLNNILSDLSDSHA